MNWIANTIVIVLLAAALFFAVRAVWKNRKKGCCGSCGGCSAAGSCPHKK